jgi:hypothetical protein
MKVRLTLNPGDRGTAFIKVKWNEKNVQEQVKRAGGRWDKIRKLWKLPYGKVNDLGLISRFVGIAQ